MRLVAVLGTCLLLAACAALNDYDRKLLATQVVHRYIADGGDEADVRATRAKQLGKFLRNMSDVDGLTGNAFNAGIKAILDRQSLPAHDKALLEWFFFRLDIPDVELPVEEEHLRIMRVYSAAILEAVDSYESPT